jgi:putative glycosyltransferase
MKLSIVTTLYKSAPYIYEFFYKIKKQVLDITNDYEIIFVNDGSPDESLKIALDIFQKEENVTVIEFSRNFGHHDAMRAGLSNTSGDFVFLIDSDLEENPKLLYEFWEKLSNNENIDVVYGYQEKRKGKLLEKISGKLYYKILNSFSDTKIKENLLTVRLMTKSYVKSLLSFNENNYIIGGIFELTGYNQFGIPVKKEDKGKSSYNIFRKVTLLINSITSFSNKPLELIFYIGLITSSVSFLGLIIILLNKLIYGFLVGWTSIIFLIIFTFGFNVTIIGIIGIYLSKIFNEVKNRPNYIIKNIYRK